MTDLLKKVSDVDLLQVGQKVKGKLIFVVKNQVLIDLENIGTGIVRAKELYNEEYLSRLKVGEEVEAIILDLDNELGMVELSFRAIGRDQMWAEITEAHATGAIVEAKIKEVNRGGFLVKVKGVDGFLPASLLSPAHAIKQVGVEDKSLLNQMKKYVGQIFKVKIVSVNAETDSVIVSEKAVSDEVTKAKLVNHHVGEVIQGVVVGVVDFGLFGRFDEDLDGLVHISEIAWKKVEDPRKEFRVGQPVTAKITHIDPESRINLSIKQTMTNPWNDFVKHVKAGDPFVGKVARIVSYGAIVVNENDIQGLCHISQIDSSTLSSPAEIHKFLKVGEEREFTILNAEMEDNVEGKLYLTLLPYEQAVEIQAKLQQEKDEKANNREEEAEQKQSEKETSSKDKAEKDEKATEKSDK